MGVVAAHAADDRHRVIIGAGGMPVHDRTQHTKNAVCLTGAARVLDQIKELGHVGPLDAYELAILKDRVNIFVQDARDLPLGA